MYEAIKKNEELWNLFTLRDEYSKADGCSNGESPGCSQEIISYPKISEFLMKNEKDKDDIEYPDGKSFAVCLTHDVDEVYPPLSHTLLSGLHLFKDGNLKDLGNFLFWKAKGSEFSPYNNFGQIMDLEESYNARSSFYFLANSRDIRRHRYNIEGLEKELGIIDDRGWEVGLHGGYYSYNSLNDIVKEKSLIEKLLGKKIVGYRNHYLKFEIPESWELLAKAGFKYDTTMGYNGNIGFRNGMCHPFNPYNLNTDRPIEIMEIPLCIMDSALLKGKYSIDKSWELISSILDATERCNGVLTLSWHSQNFGCPFRKDLIKLYGKILNRVAEKNAWITSSEEIWKFWRRI